MMTNTARNILSLAGLESQGYSLAVAAGKAVLVALGRGGAVSIEDVALDEEQWSEMVAYLGRRGVRVRDNVASVAGETEGR